MKQLSSSELNSMTKEEMAAMILQMQRLNAQMQQTQLQLQQQVHTLTEKIALMNARHFGCVRRSAKSPRPAELSSDSAQIEQWDRPD